MLTEKKILIQYKICLLAMNSMPKKFQRNGTLLKQIKNSIHEMFRNNNLNGYDHIHIQEELISKIIYLKYKVRSTHFKITESGCVKDYDKDYYNSLEYLQDAILNY